MGATGLFGLQIHPLRGTLVALQPGGVQPLRHAVGLAATGGVQRFDWLVGKQHLHGLAGVRAPFALGHQPFGDEFGHGFAGGFALAFQHGRGDGLARQLRGVEAAIADELVDRAIEAIEGAARTGKIGDGKIFVSTLEQVVRIRTGETGQEAL